MSKLKINGKEFTALEGETLIETARRAGFAIPSMCYAPGAVHKSSCMVCVVADRSTGQIIPSCTTLSREGMDIDTEAGEVMLSRRLSLELLLSDHRADCEAPCSTVCPYGLEIEQMLNLYDTHRHKEAHTLIAQAFPLPTLGCDDCKAPCEKVCRRGSVDNPVSIRAIISELTEKYEPLPAERQTDKTTEKRFNSRLGRFTAAEKERLKETTTTPSGCFHCACAAKDDCRLREYASECGIKTPRYSKESTLPALARQRIGENLVFEPAKCIRCGLCVYNTRNGFTFKGRGFAMQVVLPEEGFANVSEEVAELCPTGAIYLIRN